MCGIFGGHPELVSGRSEELLRRRGPDQQGLARLPLADGREFVIGQTRLNVVCREDVPIPMEHEGAYISFNGEIYNWPELRHQLESLGHAFRTRTDTEVMLHAFLEWGPFCLERLNGMFAVAIFHAGRLFLARDRLGVKPLFYTHTSRGLAFSSELKCFRELDFAEVPICQQLEFYFDEHTPFRNVKSVRPGEYVLYEPAIDRFTRHRWWSFPEGGESQADEASAVDEFLDLFTDACRIRSVADVPVTLFLSGGVDSSLIQAVLQLDTTYTIQFAEFEETINERDYVLEFAEQLGFEPRIVTPDRQQFLDSFPELARSIEFPVGSLSVFPLYALSRAAHEDGYVVALSGEGADELFTGYYRHELLLLEASRLQEELSGPYGTLCRRYFGSPVERFCRMASRHGPGGVAPLLEFFGPRWKEEQTFAQNLSRIEATVFLQPLLVMADRLSMRNSLEVRNPFLDYRLVEFSAGLPEHLKFRNGRGKWLLRRALERLVGPDIGIAKRRVKHGLPAPVNQWLFNSSAFDRKDWNHLLLGECLRQLVVAQDGVRDSGEA